MTENTTFDSILHMLRMVLQTDVKRQALVGTCLWQFGSIFEKITHLFYADVFYLLKGVGDSDYVCIIYVYCWLSKNKICKYTK